MHQVGGGDGPSTVAASVSEAVSMKTRSMCCFLFSCEGRFCLIRTCRTSSATLACNANTMWRKLLYSGFHMPKAVT